MKRLVILTVFLSFGISFTIRAQEAEVKWYTFEEAIELNKTEHRKIFIDVYTDWCGWCKKMEATTFTHPAIAKILNEEYYAVRFDAETNDTIFFAGHTFVNEGGRSRSPHQLAIALLQGKMSYPSLAFLLENNQPVVVPGYKSASSLEPILMFLAEDAFKTTSFEEYQKTFKSDIKTN